MRLLVLAACVALSVALLGPSGAEAKGTSYLLSGGALGTSAALLPGFIPDRDGTDWVANVEGTAVAAPHELPSLSYDLYLRYGVMAVPHQMNVTGPEMRYYPELRLIHHVWSDRWVEVPHPAAEYVDAQIDDALAKKARGELDDNPFVADLRDRRMHEVTYWLRPLAGVESGEDYYSPMMNACEGCIFLPAGSSEEFVLHDLLETVSRPPVASTPVRPVFVIEYEGWFPEGWGIGGLLGLYAPPADGQPGRFWHDGYLYDPGTPFYETTAGFDASVAEALAAAAASPGEAASATADESDAIPIVTAVWAGLAVTAVATIVAAMALYRYARRRNKA